MNEFDELMTRHFDGELDVASAVRLRDWLKADREHLRRFLRELLFQSQLPVAARSDAFSELLLTVSLPKPETSPAREQARVPFWRACMSPWARYAAVTVGVTEPLRGGIFKTLRRAWATPC